MDWFFYEGARKPTEMEKNIIETQNIDCFFFVFFLMTESLECSFSSTFQAMNYVDHFKFRILSESV